MRFGLASAVLLAALAGLAVHAAERRGCDNLGWPQAGASSADLRDLAARCESGDAAALFYNRAYHLDLLERYRSLIRLTPASGQEDFKDYHAYRIFIGLTEALADQRRRESGRQPTAWLNSVYDRATEIAELRLRGYDLQADRLERDAWDERPPAQRD
jgi:hypothetical protein